MELRAFQLFIYERKLVFVDFTIFFSSEGVKSSRKSMQVNFHQFVLFGN
jgi:hypothetical protein